MSGLALLVPGSPGLIQGAPSPDNRVTLAWDPSPAADIVEYRIYYGYQSGAYTNVLQVGMETTATVSNLVGGATYFFVATAQDRSGLESEFSNEVSYQVPLGLGRLGVHLLPGDRLVITTVAAPGSRYEILASHDLSQWQVVGSGASDAAGALEFEDAGARTNRARFYRLRPAK